MTASCLHMTAGALCRDKMDSLTFASTPAKVSVATYLLTSYLTAMSAKVKFLYFPLHARAEVIRLTLKAGGMEYEEEIVTFDKWPAVKPHMPFATLPVLYWNDEEIGQTLTITRFLARKLGLAGNDDVEMARADCIAEQVAGLMNKFVNVRVCPDADRKKELAAKFSQEVLPQFLNSAEKKLKAVGGEYFTGGELSYGDIAMFSVLDMLSNAQLMSNSGFDSVYSDILKTLSNCSSLTKMHGMVKNMPKIASYLQSRENYDW